MESRKDQIARLLQEGFDDGEDMEALINVIKMFKVPSRSKSIDTESSTQYGTEDLKLKSLKFYFDELGIS